MDIYKTTRGRGGASWGHWQIALAYAKYLPTELHMHVNEVYMRYQLFGKNLILDSKRFAKICQDKSWTPSQNISIKPVVPPCVDSPVHAGSDLTDAIPFFG